MLLTTLALAGAVLWPALGYATRRRELLQGADEGYLWYGIQRVLAGDQPVRDVRSYEPGRYWLGAVGAHLRDDGLVTTRLVTHVTAAVSLAVLGAVLARSGAHPAALVVTPFAVVWWCSNHYKLPESAALALNVAAGVLVLTGVPAGPLWLGVAVGLTATVGWNLALYAALSGTAVLATGLATGAVTPSAALLALPGGVAGSAPLLVWFLLAPGTLRATWAARVVAPWTRGATNIPLPVPWLWRPDVAARGVSGRTMTVVLRTCYSVVPLVGLLALLVALVRGGGELARVAPFALTGLAALHTAYSRADLGHVGRPVPLLLLAACQLDGPAGAVACVVTTATTVVFTHGTHPRLHRRRSPRAFVRRRLGPDLVWVLRGFAAQLDALTEHLDDDEALAAVPFGVPLVASLGRRSAVTDTYCVYPAAPAEDAAMRDELVEAGRCLVLVDDAPLDGDPARAFSATHPITWAWLRDHGRQLPLPTPPRLLDGISLWRLDDR